MFSISWSRINSSKIQNTFLIHIIFMTTIVFFTSEAVGVCPRLLPPKGVELQCSTYVTANKTEVTRPCSVRSPINTIAKYKCKPYYTPNHDDGGQTKTKGLMKCNRKGKWRNVLHFRKFRCHLSASGWINQVIDTNRVVIFSLSYCGYCHKIKQIFHDMGVKYFAIELDLVDWKKASLLKEALWRETGMKTYPNVFINRRHIGGYDRTYAAHHYGTLQSLLDATPQPLNFNPSA